MITLQERSVRARGAIQGSLIFLQRLLKRPLISAAERDFNLHSDLRPLLFLQVVGQSKIRFRREDQMQFAPSTGLLFLVSVLVLAGCESTSQWSPTVDTYGNSRAQYLSSDMEECRSLARSSSGDTTEETVRGAGIGAFAGAAGGAILGAMIGSPARGAALGAAAGAAGGGAFSATQTEQQFKQAFSNCMRERGHNVID
jgi:uncharacterized membrane protein